MTSDTIYVYLEYCNLFSIVIELIRIDDLIASVLAASVVYRGVGSLSGQTKDYKNGICCFYTMHAALRDKINTGWLGIGIMCPSGAICIHADCCFSDLALIKSI